MFSKVSQNSCKTLVLASIFDKFAGSQASKFIKKRLQHKCFPLNFTKLLNQGS